MVEQRGLLGNYGQNMQRGFGRIGDAITGRDQNASDRLAIALMSLSGNPQQLQPLMRMAASDIQERKEQAQTNKSIEYLKTIDPRLGAMAESNPGMISSIFSDLAKKQLNPQQPRIETGRDGFKYFVTGPNAGQRVLPNQLSQEDESIYNLQQRLGVDSDTAAKMFYQQQGFVVPGSNNQTIAFLEQKAAEGDPNAQAALTLVETQGVGEAMKTYINATSTNAANKTGANTKTYPNGLTISVFQNGSKRVSGPDGTILEGPAATEAIQAAQADELRQAELTEFKTKSAAAKAGMVQSTVNNILNVDSSLRNMARAKNALRTAIANGQNITGLVTQFFPDVSVEAAELRNARNALGLDVVGSVTFGALSKGELDLALSQGLPLGLNEPQLLEFIERREAAMRKYRQSLMEAARIYADPEQNFNDYLKSLEEVEISNPYNETPDDELEQLFIQVMSGTSNISVKNRQFIVDEVDRRAEL